MQIWAEVLHWVSDEEHIPYHIYEYFPCVGTLSNFYKRLLYYKLCHFQCLIHSAQVVTVTRYLKTQYSPSSTVSVFPFVKKRKLLHGILGVV